MAAEVKRLGIVLTAEGAEDFASELKNCSNALRDNRDQLNLAKSAYDKNTSSLEKLADKQQFASKQVEAYTAKVEVLSRQLEDMKASGDASAATIAKQEHNLNQAKIQLNKYTTELETCNKALDTGVAKLQEYETKLQSIGGKMQSVGNAMTVGITAPLAALGVASVKAASDYEENLNKVDVAFGSSAQSVKDWANTATESFGLSKNAALEAAALYGDMATSMGISQQAAAGMSTQLTGLAGDLASFKNISTDQAMNALKSVFTGETESLKNLGIVMTQTNLEDFASRQGLVYSAMDESEKVTLRYQYVLEHTKNAQGDYARTADGTANTMRTFTQEVENLKVALGEQLLPAITPVIHDMTEMVKAFGKLPPGVQQAIVKLALFAAAMGPVISVSGTLIKGVGDLAGGIGKLKIALSGGTAAAAAAGAAAQAAGTEVAAGGAAAAAGAAKATAAATASTASMAGLATAAGTVAAVLPLVAGIAIPLTEEIKYQAAAFKGDTEEMKRLAAVSDECKATMEGWGGLPGEITEESTQGAAGLRELANNFKEAAKQAGNFFATLAQNAGNTIQSSIGNVKWHADAMRDGVILDKPTIFGVSGGTLQGAGEAGPEAVVGTGSLARMIQAAVSNSTVNNSGDTVINVYVDHIDDLQELIDIKNRAQQISRMGVNR